MRSIARKASLILGVLLLMLGGAILVGFVSDAYVRSKVPVGIAGVKSVSVDSWKSGYVGFTGTWEIEGDRGAFPLQVSEVWCNREHEVCTEAQGLITFNEYLSVSLEIYEIVSWNESAIVYRGEGGCVESLWTISRDTKQVTWLRKPKPGSEAIDLCKNFEQKELRGVLASPFEIWHRETDRVQPTAINVAALLLILAFGIVGIWRIIRYRNPH